MQIDELEVRITEHTYRRYCERVEPIERQALEKWVSEQFHKEWHRSCDYIQIGGVWWRCTSEDRVLTLCTCYGKSHMDLPAAVKWAKRHKDRIVLGEAYGD